MNTKYLRGLKCTINTRTIVSLIFSALASGMLSGCDDSSATKAVANANKTPRALLHEKLYAHNSANIQAYPVGNMESKAVQFALLQAKDLLSSISNFEIVVFSVGYSTSTLPQFSILITRQSNTNLLVYNHGHSGLPCNAESIHDHNGVACDEADFNGLFLLKTALDSGFDLLVTSMPLTGLNTPHPDESYFLKAGGNLNLTPVAREVITGWPSMHNLYELIDDSDHYMHYFIDGTIMPLDLVDPTFNLEGLGATGNAASNVVEGKYASISYVGLSGGASTGLVACALYKFDKCILIAGVMPEDLRLKYRSSFGDAEQQTRSLYGDFNVAELLDIIQRSGVNLTMMYNSQDGCCFSDPAATEFRERYPHMDIRIRHSDAHGFDPNAVLDTLIL